MCPEVKKKWFDCALLMNTILLSTVSDVFYGFSGEGRFAAGSKGTEEQGNIFQEAGSSAGQSSGRETKAHT